MAKNSIFNKPDEETLALLRRTADPNPQVAFAAQHELAQALQLPLREGVLVGPITDGIFTPVDLKGADAEFPLDLLAPGEEDEFVAFTIPNHGKIPERHVEGDYVRVPDYAIANAIDWLLKYAQDARYDVVGRAMQVMEAGFVKKMNDDGWHTLLAAGADRNILAYDADASAGQFTKRLISIMKVLMARNAGGNSASVKQGKLTDVFLSPEALEDIRNWGVDIVDEFTRRDIFLAADGSDKLTRLFGVNLHDIRELGESQEYQTFFTAQLGGSLASSDVELVVSMDLSTNDSFIMPIKQEVQVFEDPSLHRQLRQGYYGWTRLGFCCLDSRRIMLGLF